MREQLKLLEDLQLIDLKMQEAKEQLTALPAKVESLKKDFCRIETLLENERGQLAEAQRYKNELDAEIKEGQELIQKTKAKLQQVRNSKEYMAIQREFETNRRITSERESEISKLVEGIGKFEESINNHERELQSLQQQVQEEERQTQEQIKGLKMQVESEGVGREELASTIQKGVLRKYDAIRRFRGLAIVAAKNGVCMGCHMQLPPQLFNILQRGNSIEVCPNCNRIVYYDIPPADGSIETDNSTAEEKTSSEGDHFSE